MAALKLRQPVSRRAEKIADGDRTRPWLHSHYSDNVWIVSDTKGQGKPERIDFRFLLPDGSFLTDRPALYSTVKEFAFWIRESRYSEIHDAYTHAYRVKTLIKICYAIVGQGYNSFSELNLEEVERVTKLAALGTGELMGVLDRLSEFLAGFATWNDVTPDQKRLVKRQHSGRVDTSFAKSVVLANCNIPSQMATGKLKIVFAAAAARLDGRIVEAVEPPTQRVQANVFGVTVVFDALYRLKLLMRAPSIVFEPYPEGPYARAAALGRPTTPTPIANPDLVFGLLEGCVKTVSDDGPSIIEAHGRAVADRRNDRAYSRPAAMKARQDAFLLITACFILIAAFTARRATELSLLRRDCLFKDRHGNWWMQVYIEKNILEKTWIPVPRIVKVAVETIKAMDRDATHGELFTYFDPVSGRTSQWNTSRRISGYANHVQARGHDNDNSPKVEKWSWTAPQFRRFFAVLFFYSYRGKKESLSHHLRHFNMRTTEGYLKLDPQVNKIWLAELGRFKRFLANDIAEGRTKYVGPMGERIANAKRQWRENFDGKIVIMPERKAARLLGIMERNYWVVSPKAWATCTCPNTRAGCRRAGCQRRANASGDSVGPDFTHATPGVCCNCPWALIDDHQLDYIDGQIEALQPCNDNIWMPSIFAELQAAELLALTTFRQNGK